MITNNYREAISGTSDSEMLNCDWEDKPHRLVYDLCGEVDKLQAKELKILDAIKKCFPLPGCTAGHQIVSDNDYNNLVAIINQGDSK